MKEKKVLDLLICRASADCSQLFRAALDHLLNTMQGSLWNIVAPVQ